MNPGYQSATVRADVLILWKKLTYRQSAMLMEIFKTHFGKITFLRFNHGIDVYWLVLRKEIKFPLFARWFLIPSMVDLYFLRSTICNIVILLKIHPDRIHPVLSHLCRTALVSTGTKCSSDPFHRAYATTMIDLIFPKSFPRLVWA